MEIPTQGRNAENATSARSHVAVICFRPSMKDYHVVHVTDILQSLYNLALLVFSGVSAGSYEKGKPIVGLDKVARMKDVVVHHAGTKDADGQIVTSGGRVLNVTALGDTIAQAKQRAYDAVAQIAFDGADRRMPARHIVVVAVAHVEPEDIGARLEQLPDHFRRSAGRSEGRQHFHVPGSPHGGFLIGRLRLRHRSTWSRIRYIPIFGSVFHAGGSVSNTYAV